MKKKVSGFTIVELIAIIIIICIILIIAVPAFDDAIDNNNENIYKTYQKNMISAADIYIVKEEIIVDVNNPIARITLNNLQDSGLIAIKSNCDGYVLLEYSSNRLKRTPFLNCSDYITPGYEVIE